MPLEFLDAGFDSDFDFDDSFADDYRREQGPFWEALSFELKGIAKSNLKLQDVIRRTSAEILANAGAPSDIPAEGRCLVLDATRAIKQHRKERAATALQYIHELQQEKANTLYQHFATQGPDSERPYKVLWNLEGTTWYDGHKPGDAIWKLYPMDGRDVRRFPRVPFKWNSELIYCGEVPRPKYQNFARLEHVMPDMWGLLMAIVEWGVVRKDTAGQGLSRSGLWVLRECRQGTYEWISVGYLKALWDWCFADGFGFANTQRKLQTDPMIIEVAFLLNIFSESPNPNLERSMKNILSMLEDCTGLKVQQLVERYEADRLEHHRVAIIDNGNDEARRPNPLLVHEDCPHDIHEYYGQPKFLNDPFRIGHIAQPGLNLVTYLQDILAECPNVLNSVANTVERRIPAEPLCVRFIASRDKFAGYCPREICIATLRLFDLEYNLPVDRRPLPFPGVGSYTNPWAQAYISWNEERPLHAEYHPSEPFSIEDAARVPAGEIAVNPPLVEEPPAEPCTELNIFDFIRDEDFVPGDHVPASADSNTVGPFLDN